MELICVQELTLTSTQHIYQKHRSELDCSDLSQSTLPLTEDEEYDCTYYDDNQTEIVTECETTEDRKQMSALFLLKTKEVHKVTEKALDGVIQDMSSFIKLITDFMEHNIRQCLDQNNITLDTNLRMFFYSILHLILFKDYIQSIFKNNITMTFLDYWYVAKVYMYITCV